MMETLKTSDLKVNNDRINKIGYFTFTLSAELKTNLNFQTTISLQPSFV